WLSLVERFSIPGMYLHYALRKQVIEAIAREQLERGVVRQVVVIAAGFDPLAALLAPSHPELQFFELDHPATQKLKRAALHDPPPNLRLISSDLTKVPVDAALKGTGFSPDLPTLFIAEGITMYLDTRQIDSFLAEVRAAAPVAGTSIIFTYFARSPLGTLGFDNMTAISHWWLAMKKEPFRWGIEIEALGPFLQARGFTLRRNVTAADMAARYLQGRDERLPRGENIAWAALQAPD
ncbi:MAG TPA: SAM-dependent methyltransferase, partial [Patescibacteria group bacterium]|nr:SAM-dependent methyltransferase [Patescibacteria group bacterium]